MQSWQLQEAKARMSELVKKAQQHPQEITLHGKAVAVLVSRETFERLTAAQGSLLDFMQRSPLAAAEDVHFQRDTSKARKIKL